MFHVVLVLAVRFPAHSLSASIPRSVGIFAHSVLVFISFVLFQLLILVALTLASSLLAYEQNGVDWVKDRHMSLTWQGL
jgi:hypothetical protein